MKKLLSILLAVVMIMAFAVPAMAAEATETTEPELYAYAYAYDMTYYVGGYGAVPNRYQCQIRSEDGGWSEWFDISYGDPIVAEWPTEAGTYTVTFDKTTAIEDAGDTEYTFNVSMNITVLELPATSGKCGDNMTWSFDTTTDTLTISGTGDMYIIGEDWSSQLNYEPDWFKLPAKHIVVEEGVENLSNFAFFQDGGHYSQLIETIQLPTTLKTFPNMLASMSLKTLHIPEGITELGGWFFGSPGNSFGDLDNLYLPSTLTKLDMASVIIASIGDAGKMIESTPDFPTIYFAGTQEQWDAVEMVETIYVEDGMGALDNAFMDQFCMQLYGKTVAELFAELTIVCTGGENIPGEEGIIVDNGAATVPDSTVEITEGEDVVIDVTGTEETVSSVIIGSETVDKIADAETAVQIKLPGATVSFDKTAIGSIDKQSGDAAVTIVATEVEDTDLTATQKAALEDKEVCVVLKLEAFAGTTKITEFDGGTVKVSVPFELPEGKDGTDYYVAYVAKDGTITAMPTTYTDGVLTFETTHFSNYVVLENTPVAPPAEDTTKPTVAPTEAPTKAPTEAPTQAPTEAPTQAPTEAPTEVPTQAPTQAPTQVPTDNEPDVDAPPPTGNGHLLLLVTVMLLGVVGMVLCLNKRRAF